MTSRGERINVCPVDGEPVVFTFEFPGAEYHCPACGWIGGTPHGMSEPATIELAEHAARVVRDYRHAYAARLGRPAPVDDVEGPRPVCVGCGKTAEGPMEGNKPAHWFVRKRDGVDEFACSRDCIPASESILLW